MATQNTECVKLSSGIRYSESEMFNRNIYRHLRFRYPTYIFSDQIFFEIDDEGTPYWVCPVKKFNIGLFGGQTIGKAILCNAITGACEEYDVKDVPTWVDKVYSAELLTGLYNYHGILKHGYFNSILGQKDCLQTTNGYNYIALNDDVWVYTGVTSVSGDQSNVGFVLMNQRTMETKFYRIEGVGAPAKAVFGARVDHHGGVHLVKDACLGHGHLSAEVLLGRGSHDPYPSAQLADDRFQRRSGPHADGRDQVMAAAMANLRQGVVFAEIGDGGAGLSGIVSADKAGRNHKSGLYIEALLFQHPSQQGHGFEFLVANFGVAVHLLNGGHIPVQALGDIFFYRF